METRSTLSLGSQFRDAESSNAKPNYPPRLFEIGKAPIQTHSMNYNSYLNKFGIMEEGVGEDVVNYLKDSSVGVFVKMAGERYIFSAKLVHHFLSNQLATPKPHEFWALVADEPLRFSLHEFSEITGMNCGPIGDEDKWDIDHTVFWGELGVATSSGPSWTELCNVLEICATWSYEKRRMVGLLCVLAIAVFGIHNESRIPLASAKRVLDLEAFERYSWGRVACDSLVTGVKVLTCDKNSYHVKGFVQALHIWAFESVVGFGEHFGRRKVGVENVVPLLRWSGSKKHFNFESFMKKELENHGRIRVRNCVVKPYEEIFPLWDYDVEETKVANLLQDLPLGKFIPRFYAVTRKNKAKKRKVDSDVTTSQKKSKESVSVEGGSGCRNSNDELLETEKLGISQILTDFGAKFGSMEDNIKALIVNSTTVLEAKIEAKHEATFDELRAKIQHLETVLQDMKEKEKEPELKDTVSHVKTDVKKAESSSKSLSWIVNKVVNSDDGIPIVCASKKAGLLTKSKARESVGKDVTSKMKEVVTKKAMKPEPKSKKNKTTVKQEIVDDESLKQEKEKKTNTPVPENGSSNSADFSNSQARRRDNCVEIFMGGMRVSMQDLQEREERDKLKEKKRRVVRSKTQVHPFIGNSTMKRVIPDVVINPISLVQPEKLENLMNFIEENKSNPVGRNRGVKYLRLMTPKKNWPKDEQDYGWLHDGHMEDIMKMFTMRSVFEDSPYRSARIAFLYPVFVKGWAKDCLKFDKDPKKFKFGKGYISAFEGSYYDTVKTNQKWYIDVDHLYLTYHIRHDHWGALDINLKEERIDVYDSSPSMTRNNDVTESLKPFARMTPHLLNKQIPPKLRKKTVAMFKINRVKNLPRNIDIGDCGVYAVKFIEHLALGKDFMEICDANMAAYRLQLACDTFHEVPIPETFDIPELNDADVEILGDNPYE